jgi:hypothetical protein
MFVPIEKSLEFPSANDEQHEMICLQKKSVSPISFVLLAASIVVPPPPSPPTHKPHLSAAGHEPLAEVAGIHP